jgi:hypothetical protein
MKKKTAYGLLAFLVIVYLLVTFAIPPDPKALATYHISVAQVRLISLSFTVPIILIWTAGFYGFVQFKQYALKIKKSPDGKALNSIANGLTIFAISSPISSLISSASQYYVRSHPDFKSVSTLITSYFSLAIYLLTFWFIAKGAKKLIEIVKQEVEIGDQILALFGFVVAGGIYLYTALRAVSADHAVKVTLFDFLSKPAALITVIIPYMVIWLIALWAVARISLYRVLIEGSIYKKALSNLSAGVALVVVTSILVQMLNTTGSSLLKLNLNQLLMLIYGLLAVIAAGFIMIALGAKKLRKIEEI